MSLPADAPSARCIVRLIGVYDADGGLRGEATYVVGHLLGRLHCGLCDITHGPLRRKRAWDALASRLGVPFELLHRNEQPADLARLTRDSGLASVVAQTADGRLRVVLEPRDLDEVGGDVSRFGSALLAALDRLQLLLPVAA